LDPKVSVALVVELMVVLMAILLPVSAVEQQLLSETL
jgi:hypothetical protein